MVDFLSKIDVQLKLIEDTVCGASRGYALSDEEWGELLDKVYEACDEVRKTAEEIIRV